MWIQPTKPSESLGIYLELQVLSSWQKGPTNKPALFQLWQRAESKASQTWTINYISKVQRITKKIRKRGRLYEMSIQKANVSANLVHWSKGTSHVLRWYLSYINRHLNRRKTSRLLPLSTLLGSPNKWKIHKSVIKITT